MIYSVLCIKEYGDVDHDVAHLYEHLYLRRLYLELETAGIPQYIACNINGSTYHTNLITLEIESYSSSTADFFEKLLKQKETPFSKSELLIGLKEIQHEALHGTIHDLESVETAVNELAKLEWKRVEDLDFTYYTAPSDAKVSERQLLTFDDKPLALKAFRIDITLPQKAYGEDLRFYAVYALLSIFIRNALWYRFLTRHAIYPHGDNDETAVIFKRHMRTRVVLAVPKSLNIEEAENEVDATLSYLRSSEVLKLIREQALAHAASADWQRRYGLEYFTYQNFLIGQKGVAKIFTHESICTVLDKLEYSVRATEADSTK